MMNLGFGRSVPIVRRRIPILNVRTTVVERIIGNKTIGKTIGNKTLVAGKNHALGKSLGSKTSNLLKESRRLSTELPMALLQDHM
jgi:hypothetical protein